MDKNLEVIKIVRTETFDDVGFKILLTSQDKSLKITVTARKVEPWQVGDIYVLQLLNSQSKLLPMVPD